MSKKNPQQTTDSFNPVIHHTPAAFQIHKKYLGGIQNGADAMTREIDQEILENLRVGAERNTDDHCGYSEGTWENYEAFRKKREESLGGPGKNSGSSEIPPRK